MIIFNCFSNYGDCFLKAATTTPTITKTTATTATPIQPKGRN